MAAELLDGRLHSQTWRAEIGTRIAALAARGIVPRVAVVRLGDDPGSVSYAASLARTFDKAGVELRLTHLPADTPRSEALAVLGALNAAPAVHGILLQEPVPEPLDTAELQRHLEPLKDVDGVHPLNAGLLFGDQPTGFIPATALGGLELLRRCGIELSGRRAVVVGRSPIVGRPFALLLLHAHATVTICHSRTRDLAAVCREADLLAVAVGRAGFLTPDMVRPGATVLDFGINFESGQLVGDVAPEVAEVAGQLSPTPGGTGSMTTAALLHNVVTAAERAAG